MTGHVCITEICTVLLTQYLCTLQSQSDTYQSQLGKRKEMMDTTEQNLRAQISQLESQLQRARDTINSQVQNPGDCVRGEV